MLYGVYFNLGLYAELRVQIHLKSPCPQYKRLYFVHYLVVKLYDVVVKPPCDIPEMG
jgi:hypothetical protein